MLNRLHKKLVRHWRAQSLNSEVQQVHLHQIQGRIRENIDRSAEGESTIGEFIDEMEKLCSREQRILYEVLPKVGVVCGALVGMSDCIKAIGGLLGEIVVVEGTCEGLGTKVLEAGEIEGTAEAELRDSRERVLESGRRWMSFG